MQYALSENPSASAWLELDPPDLPHRPHSDEPPSRKSPGSSPARLEVSTPKRPRAVSSPPMSPTASKGSSNGKAGDERTQCSGRTKKGERCTRQVKTDPALNALYPDIAVERFCFQHKKEVNEQSGYYWKSNVWVDFSEYIPGYLHPDTQAALRVEMEKPPTKSDEPGYIYTFEIRDPSTPFMIYLKVGRTVELNTRLNNWKKQCGSKEQILRGWWPGTVANDNGNNNNGETSLMKGRVKPGEKGAFCHKLERLVHLELADLVVYAPYLNPDFQNVSGEESTSARIPRSNPGTPGKGGKRAGASSAALNSLQQGNVPCADCGTVHKEIFSFLRPEKGSYKGREWDLLVMPVIEKWGRFVESLR
ncbi:uncharacterized protein FOMMEDRAFT_104617 [Fomitiporia mediterranea MF3/22]|uniref:uncharacterized protein n=1 Tax=Fomitiporia mediterranea (strain MF3/22) TaxID=694068 RepID=UPI0004407890|nr:uncharacterized protein FOMMEDRAFT_104617 [Fomitiporia mediterranea MF3/22]EJD06127.1 hypothetical protein FOMMEDRAFT_104617 [Fomitiporia mediterranea MF3/22]